MTVSTSGADPDPDGYVATLDGTGSPLSFPDNGSAFVDAPVGEHTVALDGLSCNCTLDAASQQVTVTEGATATVSFTVSCTAVPENTGSIRVVTSTMGSNLDPDGYQFAVDGGASQAIGTSATTTLNDAVLGSHHVALSGLAANCGTAGGWSKEIMVTGGDTANAVFPVTCYPVGPSPALSSLSADPVSISIAQTSIITVAVVDPSKCPDAGFPGDPERDRHREHDHTLAQPGIGDHECGRDGDIPVQLQCPRDETAVNGVALEHTQAITVGKAVSFVGIIAAVPEPSTSGETFRFTVVIACERGTRSTDGTVAVSSNLEPDAGCDAAPLTPDVNESFATCEMTSTTVGTQMLNATYSGDGEFEGSTATPVEHVVIAPAP